MWFSPHSYFFTQSNGSAIGSIGLLPLASSFCLVVYAIGKPTKKEQTNGN